MAANESTKYTHFSNVSIGTASGGGDLQVAGDLIFGVGGNINADSGTATAAAAAATLSKMAGKVTSEALTTAGLASYTLTLTNTVIAAADLVLASVANGTSTAGTPLIGKITPGAGSCTIEVYNAHATVAFNGTVVVSFLVIKA